MLDPRPAVVERERNGELVERRSAEPHVAGDVDRAALAAAQRLLQVDADDPAVRSLERRRPAQVGDCRGRRGTGGLDSQSRPAAPGRDRLAKIDQSGAEVRVGKLGARADIKVLPDPFDAGLAVEAAIVAAASMRLALKRPSLTMTDAAALERVWP